MLLQVKRFKDSLQEWLGSGETWDWLGLSTVLLLGTLIIGFILLIVWQGISAFWPMTLEEWVVTDADGGVRTYIAERVDQRAVVSEVEGSEALEEVLLYKQTYEDGEAVWRYEWQLKDKAEYISQPNSLLKVQLKSGHVLAGYPLAILENGKPAANNEWGVLRAVDTWLIHPQTNDVTAELILGLDDDEKISIMHSDITAITKPNTISWPGRLIITIRDFAWYLSHGEELQQNPGILPAIIGTLLLVMLMTIMLAPLGVLTAVFLHEYRERLWLTRLLHIAISNLAGVPGIVYGVFVLGFFVHGVGGGLDSIIFGDDSSQRFFANNSLLWAALVLALLNIPVVVMATEEGLARIPDDMRFAALALGATKAEMIWGVVVQAARPAVLTGLILAVARAAGEVAPLLLIGVVGFSGQPLVDSQLPYLHVERPLTHLGYQVYEFAIQSGSPYQSVPRAYATTLILLILVLLLNLLAIRLRSNLQQRYHTNKAY